MSSNPIFTPVQASESAILNAALQNGNLYFATDTGKMYLDTPTRRISVGGSGGGGGAAIYYGTASEPVFDKTADEYLFSKAEVGNAILKEGDLILNVDGGFYKVKSIADESYICTLLAVSGSSSSGPSINEVNPTIKFSIGNTNLING
jgi:hypothetical protein